MWRKIPHPTYGNCGGGKLDCSGGGTPIDAMDEAFLMHDINLYAARQMDTDAEMEMAAQDADRILVKTLKRTKVRGWYANLYRIGAIMVFRWR